MGLLIIYLLTNWLPTLIGGTGFSLGEAATISAMFQLGGTLGALLLGSAMDRFDAHRVLSLAYVGGALFILGIASLYHNFALLALCVAGVGFCISGSQVGANALAADFYPTRSRATGVSWASAWAASARSSAPLAAAPCSAWAWASAASSPCW